MYERHYNQTAGLSDLPDACADEGPSSDCDHCASSVVLKRPADENHLSTFHPISTALGRGGPLSSLFKRQRYFKENLHCVDPVEYILDFQKNKTFQYVTILIFSVHLYPALEIRSQFLIANFTSKMIFMLKRKHDFH